MLVILFCRESMARKESLTKEAVLGFRHMPLLETDHMWMIWREERDDALARAGVGVVVHDCRIERASRRRTSMLVGVGGREGGDLDVLTFRGTLCYEAFMCRRCVASCTRPGVLVRGKRRGAERQHTVVPAYCGVV